MWRLGAGPISGEKPRASKGMTRFCWASTLTDVMQTKGTAVVSQRAAVVVVGAAGGGGGGGRRRGGRGRGGRCGGRGTCRGDHGRGGRGCGRRGRPVVRPDGGV